MEKYKFEFSRWHFNYDNFKQKNITILRNTIEQSRLANEIKFDNYANLSFDEEDSILKYPIVSILEEYNRNKTNCIVYNILNKDLEGIFNKLFIIQYIGKIESHYGLVFYNDITHKFFHKFFINYDLSDLCIHINKSFTTLKFNEKVNEYNKEHNKNILY